MLKVTKWIIIPQIKEEKVVFELITYDLESSINIISVIRGLNLTLTLKDFIKDDTTNQYVHYVIRKKGYQDCKYTIDLNPIRVWSNHDLEELKHYLR